MTLLVAWLWQGLLVAMVATIATRVVPAGAAAARHLLWWLALILVLVSPAVPLLSLLATPALGVVWEVTQPSAGSGLVTLPQPPSWLMPVVLVFWAFRAVMGLVRLLRNATSLRALVGAAQPFDLIREARLPIWQRARGNQRVALKVSGHIRGACAVGFLEPTLLVSSDLVASLDDPQLEAIVLHEFAHLERRDDWSGLLQQLCIALGGVHPAVYWISRQIDLEREAACDQRVVGWTGAPLLYARSLAAAAETAWRSGQSTPALAPGSSTTGSMLRVRVERLLSEHRPRVQRIWAGAASGAAAIASAAVLAAQAPNIVTFVALSTSLFAVPHAWVEGATMPGATVVLVSSAIGPTAEVTTQASRTTAPAPTVLDSTPERPLSPVAPPSEPVDGHPIPPLSSTMLQTPIALPVSGRERDTRRDAFASPFVDLGSAVAGAGVQTAQTTARASKAVGRWFTRF